MQFLIPILIIAIGLAVRYLWVKVRHEKLIDELCEDFCQVHATIETSTEFSDFNLIEDMITQIEYKYYGRIKNAILANAIASLTCRKEHAENELCAKMAHG